MNEILTLQNVSLVYHTKQGETQAINSLSFSVCEGEFIAIIGPSGCGKTTVLSLIAGLIKPSGGKVLLYGKEILKPETNLGYMLQKDQLFPWRTIEKNLYLPLEIKKICTESNKEYALSLANKYGLKDSNCLNCACDTCWKLAIKQEINRKIKVLTDLLESIEKSNNEEEM